MQYIKVNEPSTVRRTVLFDIRATDGVTPALGEAGGQPQISINLGAWTNVGISTLVSLGNGRYYATYTLDTVSVVGRKIASRYKSGSTAETPGENAEVVSFDFTNPPYIIGGPGSKEVIIEVRDDSNNPISGAEVWVTTDLAGNNTVAGTLLTDDFGIVKFMLDVGIYYIWRDSPRFTFDNPYTINVT